MTLLVKGKALLRNPTLGQSRFIEGSYPVGVAAPVVVPAVARRARPLCSANVDLTGVVVSLTAANDYGGAQLLTFANTNMLIVGAIIDAVATMAGFASNVGTGVTFGLGSATASNATLSSTMQDYLNVTTATGAGATATLKGHSFDNGSPALTFLDAAAANKLFLNAACPVTSGTGTLTFTSGFCELFYFDLRETS